MIAEDMQLELGQTVTHVDQAGLTLRSHYLTVVQVGALLHCSKTTILRYIKKGKLPKPIHRSGASNSPLLFHIDDLARYGFKFSKVKITDIDVINTREGGFLLDLPSQCTSASRLAF